MRGILNICVLILYCIHFCDGNAASDDPPTVMTTSGQVTGQLTELARVFKGIPYAESVSGINRWTDPKPKQPNGSMVLTSDDPPGCPQICSLATLCPKSQSEDCLSLNVFTPLHQDPSNLNAVLVYIHGGAFIDGHSSMYDGSSLANSSNIIVVTINYRLGVLGFLVYGYGNDAIKGNFGIKDQVLALQWVQKNILAFGGNPNKVTLSGESAGAMSVAIHMTNQISEYATLFQQAIIESDPFGLNYATIESVKESCAPQFEECGKNNVTCLRSMNLYVLLKKQCTPAIENITSPLLQWGPVIESHSLLRGQPLALFQKGEFGSVPAIIGTTTGEGIIFVHTVWKDLSKIFSSPDDFMSSDDYAVVVYVLFGEQILLLYPPEEDTGIDHLPKLSQLLTDYQFYFPTILAAKSNSDPVFSYIFDQPSTRDISTYPDINDVCDTHSCHGAELPYVFNGLSNNATEEEHDLADEVSRYWGNFVKQGSPENGWPSNVDDDGRWRSLMMDASVSQVVTNYRKDFCDELDKIGYGSVLFEAMHKAFVSMATVKGAATSK